MSVIFNAALTCLAIATAIATFLPLTSSKRWWIRGLEFPRLQLMVLALCLIVPVWLWTQAAVLLVAILAVSAAYQALRILPYTPFWPKEIALGDPHDGTWITAMSSNVEMGNRDYTKVAKEIDSSDPDIVFLMETDGAWDAALTAQITRYPFVKKELLSNFYGMIFATRLDVVSCEFTYLTHDDTPTLFAILRDHDGAEFRFIGLHPRPPLPGDDTDDRDAQIHYTAEIARLTDLPVVIMGDFNDAAWSNTSQRFKKIGHYLDPRIGRGIYPSFDANSWLIRAPIDQLFVSADMAIAQFWRGPNVGSDHFPIHAAVRPAPQSVAHTADDAQNPTTAHDADLKPVRTALRENLTDGNID